MSRLVTIVFALLLVALPAGAASAKEIESARVCGANQCRTIDDRDTLMTLADGGDTKPPPKNPAGGWYAVRFVIRAEDQVDSWSVAVVPSTRHLRGYDSGTGRYLWGDMTEAAAASYRKIVAGMEPKPISSLRGLNQGPPAVIVDEVIEPPAQPAAQPAGAFPWEWVAGGLGATVLAAGAFVLAWRRRRGSAPGQPGPQTAG